MRRYGVAGIGERMAKQLDYHTIREIFTRFQASEPEPKGELNHVNAYTLVVAVALSAQATDAGVNKATEKLFQIADTPEKMLALGEEGVTEHIKTIGLYRNKAKNVIKMAKILVEDYGGEVPNSRAALESLPGVGRKTANVVLNMWWRFPAQAVDTHIFRVGNRTGVAPGRDVVAVDVLIRCPWSWAETVAGSSPSTLKTTIPPLRAPLSWTVTRSRESSPVRRRAPSSRVRAEVASIPRSSA